jgi:hypothetical protein
MRRLSGFAFGKLNAKTNPEDDVEKAQPAKFAVIQEHWNARGPYVFRDRDCIGICDTDNATQSVMEARARMMAAAPDLFNAIHQSDDMHWTPAMRAAMRKAVGE